MLLFLKNGIGYNWATLWRSRLILQPKDLRSNPKNPDPSWRRLGLMVETSHPQVIGLFSGNPFFSDIHIGSLGKKQMGPSSAKYTAGGQPKKLNTWDVTATLGGFRWDMDSMIPFLIRSRLKCNFVSGGSDFLQLVNFLGGIYRLTFRTKKWLDGSSKFGGFHMLIRIHKIKRILSPYFKWTNQRLCHLIHVKKICD